MNCIWMTSELVKFKLCDKEFDCENCEFDKVFRNLSIKMSEKNAPSPASGDFFERLIHRIENETFDERAVYLKNQLIIKNLFGNAYYLGINPVVLYLLDDFESMQEFHNEEIKKDQIIFNIEGKWGIKQFVSPINFMIIEKINFSQFQHNRWYAVILFNDADKESCQISYDEWLKQRNTLLTRLKSYSVLVPPVGKTMMDGGERVKYLHQLIGNKEYLNLLNNFFI